MTDWRARFLEDQRLAPDYLATAARHFDPLAERVARERGSRGETLRVALNGSQGSGKSTLSAYLTEALREDHGLSAIALSLDDFYLTKAERSALAESVHPLLATRGVPGTHDVTLLRDTLAALAAPGPAAVAVPRFAKALDDRAPPSQWPDIPAPVDIILLEGWCLGARAETADELAVPVNDLERDEDPEGLWRRYVNERLANDYEPLYAIFDLWVMLAAPGFAQVLSWRQEQEEKLAAKTGGEGAGLMDAARLRRFVAHYERLTRRCLSDLPARVDVLYQLDENRRIAAVRGLEG